MKRELLIILAFSLTGLVFASKNDGETRTAKATYSVNPNDVINLQAKYTDVYIEAWNKNEVEIEATIRYDGKMTDKMQTFLDSFEDEVKSNIEENVGELLIKTNLDEPNKFQIGSKHVGIVIGFNEDELRLDYKIKMPGTNALKVKNSYKDLIMTGTFSDVEIDQYSGDLKAGVIEKVELKMKYGSAFFEEIGTADMELYEQEITADKIGTSDINTKYSEFKIKEMGTTDIVSYETEFEIGTLTKMEGNIKYGKMEVTQRFEEGELTTYEFDIEANSIGSLTMESKYGSIEANYIETLELDQSYEDEFDFEKAGTIISENTKYGEYKIETLDGKIELAGYEDEVYIDGFTSNASAIEIRGKYIDMKLDTDNRAYVLKADTKYGKMDIDRDNMNIKRYIKDGDQLEIEATSTSTGESPLQISINGYEMKLELD